MHSKNSLRFIALVSVFSLLLTSAACNSRPADTAATPSVAPSRVAVVRPRVPKSLAADPAIEARSRETLAKLASEEFEGRGVGTKGLDLAADYIAARFENIALAKLPGQQSYFQPFEHQTSTTIGDATTVAINGRELKLRDDYTPVGFTSEGKFDGDVVFVGYGISEPQKYKYDDYAGLDVKGKVVVALRYEPRDSEGKSRFTKADEWSPAAALTAKAHAAKKHGASALVLVNPPNARGGVIETPSVPATQPSVASHPAEPTTVPSTQPTRGGRRQRDRDREPDRLLGFQSSMSGRGDLPIVHVRQRIIDDMLKVAGIEDLRHLQAQIDQTGESASFVMKGATAAGNIELKQNFATVKNVVAILPGKGPNADEFVIVGAHYDHLGRGQSGSLSGAREIHFGADDNASGTTALIEIAEQMALSGPRERSVVFIAFTAEEVGLLGSQHFVENPAIDLDKVVGMLNMDMVGRVRDGTMFVGGSGTADFFGPLLEVADAASPLELRYSSAIVGIGGMGPSDHQTFALKKIPVLFFFSGMHPEYHRPADTAEKVNYTGVAESVALAQYLVEEMCRMPRQQYVAKHDSMGRLGSGSGGSGASLGVIPDYNAGESTNGVRISGTREGSAAADAGLQAGDVVTGLGDYKIGSIYDLTDALVKLKPGDKIKVTVKRGEQEVQLDATLGAPRGG